MFQTVLLCLLNKPIINKLLLFLSSPSGHYLVPKPSSEAEARHGGVEEGRGNCESALAKELSRERQRPGHPEEESHARRTLVSAVPAEFAIEMKTVRCRLFPTQSQPNGIPSLEYAQRNTNAGLCT